MMRCEEPGCNNDGYPCYLPDNAIFERDAAGQLTQVETEPDYYYCAVHAYPNGFCAACGMFYGGIESFDFNNPSHLCDTCRSELDEDEDDDMDEVYSVYPFDSEDDWT